MFVQKLFTTYTYEKHYMYKNRATLCTSTMHCLYARKSVLRVCSNIWLLVHFLLALEELTNIELANVMYFLAIFFYSI